VGIRSSGIRIGDIRWNLGVSSVCTCVLLTRVCTSGSKYIVIDVVPVYDIVSMV